MEGFEIATRVFGRLTKSVFVGATSVIGGIIIAYALPVIGSWLLKHEAFSFNRWTPINFYLSVLAFGFPSLLIGLPIQAFLQKLGWTGLLSNLATAILVGFPAGVWWTTAALQALDDDEGQTTQPFLPQLYDAILDMKDWHSNGWSILLYLISSALIFWLIRRPDKDAKPLP